MKEELADRQAQRPFQHILDDHVSHITPDEWRRVVREYGALKDALAAIANYPHPFTSETAYCMADIGIPALAET